MDQAVLVTQPAHADRPSRAQIEPAALELLARHSAGLLACARRWSVTPEDAEDAYQRGVEILLTKAPTTTEDELLPWLKTVVKHEAHAVRTSYRRELTEPLGERDIRPVEDAWTDERAERYEQLRVGAEAMARLKPQEIRCLLLRAEGLSYKEICAATGFSYTKVNRCVTEGRRAFLNRVASIEAGAECERLAPLISKIADGEASAAEMRHMRPHLKGCLACKATLREYRATPARLAGLVPPVVALSTPGAGGGFMTRLMELLQTKTAAVAASAVVLAGGGAAGVDALHHDPPPVAPTAFQREQDQPTATQPIPAPDPAAAPAPAVTEPAAYVDPAPEAQQPPEEPAAPDPAPEFDPGATSSDDQPKVDGRRPMADGLRPEFGP